MMTIISSQRFRDPEIVEAKKEMLISVNAKSIEVPVIRAYYQDLDENELYIMVDRHHTLSAAQELGLEINFVEVEDEVSYYADIEEHNGENILAANYEGEAWYYITNEDEDMIGVDVW